MEDKDLDNLVLKLAESIDIKVKEEVYLQTLSKDKEVSALHREIRDDIKGLIAALAEVKEKVDAHDLVINEIMDIYKTSSRITRGILWLIVFVPGAAAFVAGLNYFYHLNK